MDRRDLLKTAAVSAAALSLGALAEEPKAAAGGAALPPLNQPLYDAAQACLRAGDVCLEHCVRSLAAGEKMMAECAVTVRQMLVTCQATAELAVQRSSHLKAMAALCAKVCRECETACKKHANHHAECKGCMEACQRCASECEKLA
jgi:Cys-rich four helix bundle protein (predicted Tat secretion target)